MRRFSSAADAVRRALFPHECAGCGKEGEALCDGCAIETMGPRKGLFACPRCGTRTAFGGRCGGRACGAHPLAGLAAAAPYGDRTLRGLLRLWKYDRVDEAGAAVLNAFRSFLERHDAALRPDLASADAVVPVPLSAFRRASRGFNQSEELAKGVASTFGVALGAGILRRSVGGASQAGIADAATRCANVRGAFRAAGPVKRGGRYVLVDDVATTTATLAECATALARAGAAEVRAVTVLRG